MITYTPLNFVPMVVHIGKEIERVLEEAAMPKTVFAKRIGRSPKNVHELLSRPGIDTMLLTKISRVLKHNFFAALGNEVDPKPAVPSMASEPLAQYRRSNRPPVRLVIEVDPEDPQARKEAEQMARRILQRSRITSPGT